MTLRREFIRTAAAALFLAFVTACDRTPKSIAVDFAALAEDKGAQVFNRALTAVAEDGRTVARLDARGGDGGVLLEGVLLGDGTIEVDLRGKDVAQQSFLGIAFHMVDWTQFEAVYFRPFNFRGADPERRSHSVQYVSHPAYTWQRLRAERAGEFEKEIDPPPDPNGWFRARIVLQSGRVDVYVNEAEKPSLSVEDLGSAKSGGVALFAGNNSDGTFANLKVTPTSPPGPTPASSQTVFQAAGTGNLVRLRSLVEENPEAVKARNPSGLTPLHMAALYGQRAAAEYLVEKGADLGAVARHSGTPLDVAAESGQEEFVAWLQPKGAPFTPLTFETTRLTPAVHRVAFPWGMRNNVLVVSTAAGAVIIDSGFSKRAVAELKKTVSDLSKSDILYVINTHPHGDHVAGNALAPSPQALITAESIASDASGLPAKRDSGPLKGRAGRTLPPPYSLNAGGVEMKIIPRPGLHSESDIIVYFPKESVAALGDLLLSESVPAVADVAGYLAFLEDVLDVFPEKTTFVSGHGRDLDAAGLRAYRDALKEMVGIIRQNLAAGRTADEMVKDDILKAYKARFSLLAFLTPDALIPRVAVK
ncbi:MAG: MBL fold metallo-hydrolase [Candidatus Aminicenantes bacterium]|nr:MBL fold metallo-hydrolase [Candidatus Aminicenantes bacterium]